MKSLIFGIVLLIMLPFVSIVEAIPNRSSLNFLSVEFDPMADLRGVSDNGTISVPENDYAEEKRLFLYPKVYNNVSQLLEAEVVGESAFHQNDILLGKSSSLIDATNNETLQARANKVLVAGYGLNLLSKSYYLWPKAIIPYTIDDNLKEHRKVIIGAIQEWNQKTNITMVHYDLEKDWLKSKFGARFRTLWRVHFMDTKSAKKGSTNFSFIGLRETNEYTNINRAQVISLGGYLSHSTALHEIGHAIGLWHEHNRPDRNKSIKVMNSKIQENHRDQYEIGEKDSGTMSGKYDYESIMHYSDNTFASSGDNTFTALNSRVKQHMIGRAKKLSSGDIKTVNTMYPKPARHPQDFITPLEKEEADDLDDTTEDEDTDFDTSTDFDTDFDTDYEPIPDYDPATNDDNGVVTPIRPRRKRGELSFEQKKLYFNLVLEKIGKSGYGIFTKPVNIEYKWNKRGGVASMECTVTMADPENTNNTRTYTGVIHAGATQPYIMYMKNR